MRPGIPAAWVGGGGGGSIGALAANDLAVTSTFYPGSGGGGGSADFLNRPAFGGTSGGGGGGGALRVWSATSIVVNGRVLADGGEGGDANIGTGRNAGCDPQPGAAGGGGSGGVIFLRAPSLTVGPRGARLGGGRPRGLRLALRVGRARAVGAASGASGSRPTRRCASSRGSLFRRWCRGCAPTPGAGSPGRAYVAAFPD
jgi:hypothetical protein